jgi:eukaryotic-like serine/threonine-protein kinase
LMLRKNFNANFVTAALSMILFMGFSLMEFSFFEETDQRIFHLAEKISPGFFPSDSVLSPGVNIPTFENGRKHAPANPPRFPFEWITLLVVGSSAALVFSRFGEGIKLSALLGLSGVTLAAGIFSSSLLGTGFMVSLPIGCLFFMYVAFTARELSAIKGLRRDCLDLKKMLGLNYQKQGMLDLAFEKFRECPLDNELMDHLFRLGLEYEKRDMTAEALTVYHHMNGRGGRPELSDRIAHLESGEASSGGRVYGKRNGTLSDAFVHRKTVGRYQILEELGKGTMGLIYKALDPKINRLLAIKVIRFSDDFDEGMVQEIKDRFFREAEIAGKLSHPVIVTLHDVGEDGDLTYMAMEYLEGRDLSHYCLKGNLLPIRTVLDVVTKVAEALQYAHKEKVIHRDIKPANIMLLKNGGVKVTDFGIAKAISSHKTKTGVILGTPNYMSPEQIMGHEIDAKTDIFSLGVLFFQLLTGDLPFHGENLSRLLNQITRGQHPSVRQYNPRLPRACDQIIGKALVKGREGRFATAGDMAKYLKIMLSKVDQQSGYP